MSISNVENECRIMENNIKEWEEEMKNLQKKTLDIIDTLSSPTHQQSIREKWDKDIRMEEEKSIAIWKKHIMKIKSSYNREIANGGEHMINIIKTRNEDYNARDFRNRSRPLWGT